MQRPPGHFERLPVPVVVGGVLLLTGLNAWSGAEAGFVALCFVLWMTVGLAFNWPR